MNYQFHLNVRKSNIMSELLKFRNIMIHNKIHKKLLISVSQYYPHMQYCSVNFPILILVLK